MSDLKAKRASLVEGLLKLTSDRKIKWSLNHNNDPNTTVAGSKITIIQTTNEEFEPSIRVTINNTVDKIGETFTDDDIPASPKSGYPNYYLLLEQLRELATRQASGADDILDTVLREIDLLDVPF